MRDKLSGRSRGFGFVSFVTRDAVDRATQQDHVLDGRNVRCSLRHLRGTMQAPRFSRALNDFKSIFSSVSAPILHIYQCSWLLIIFATD